MLSATEYALDADLRLRTRSDKFLALRIADARSETSKPAQSGSLRDTYTQEFSGRTRRCPRASRVSRAQTRRKDARSAE